MHNDDLNEVNNYYFNRELSWLNFNERVLLEACEKENNNPILERAKFLSITSSNFDEFFMVRVASIYDHIDVGIKEPDASGLTPEQQVLAIAHKTKKMVRQQYNYYNKELIAELRSEGIYFLKPSELNNEHLQYLNNYFIKTLYPVLTPLVVDRSRPFPLVLNKSLNIALLLQSKEDAAASDKILGMVQVPSVIDRLINIPDNENRNKKLLFFLEDLIKMNIESLFSGYHIISMACFRVTRNTDQGLDEEEADDLLEAIEEFIKKRKRGEVIRLEIEKVMNKELLKKLSEEFEVTEEAIYDISGPLDLTFLMKISAMETYNHLRYPKYVPKIIPEFSGYDNIFDAISERDIFLHHPYYSFDYVIELVKRAAYDPGVLAIKQTLYRVSGNSPIVAALAEAAQNGKQVTVLVELKARFDEQNNINWAKQLEMAGCHVIYGIVGLKTHCKMLLIVRMEDDEVKRYVHLGTGNYNDTTAKFYTDVGIMTCNPYFGADASAIFNMLSSYSKISSLYKLDIAPLTLRKKFVSLIRQETQNAKAGMKAHIIAKVNSLVDENIINELYAASKAGVKIELIVRGVCCLMPGIKGISDNITVISIVGRFLEHSRIFYFHNAGEELMYISSSDWMARNLDRRIELLIPIEDKAIFKKLYKVLNSTLKDNVKARVLDKSGKYRRVNNKAEPFSCQDYFCL